MEEKTTNQTVFPEWKSFLGTMEKTKPEILRSVVKRSGEIEAYNRKKIEKAINKAITAVEGSPNDEKAVFLTDKVEEKLKNIMASRYAHSIPAIEEIQDVVELVLIEQQEARLAKAYILYRAKREAVRDAESLMLNINSTMDGYLSQTFL